MLAGPPGTSRCSGGSDLRVVFDAVDLIDNGGDFIGFQDGGAHQEAGEVKAEAFFFGHSHEVSLGKMFFLSHRKLGPVSWTTDLS